MSAEIYTVGLVACASQKLPHPAPAPDLYVSQLFRKASAYAELTCDRWFVLSAKHGLLHPDRVIEPYDMRLGSGRRNPQLQQWRGMVQGQLEVELAGVENVKLLVLAGAQYRHAVCSSRWEHEIPLKGLGIGQQLGWLTARLSGGVDRH